MLKPLEVFAAGNNVDDDNDAVFAETHQNRLINALTLTETTDTTTTPLVDASGRNGQFVTIVKQVRSCELESRSASNECL